MRMNDNHSIYDELDQYPIITQFMIFFVNLNILRHLSSLFKNAFLAIMC